MEKALVTQKSWGWRVAAYLFLAGLGSGSTFVGITYGLLFRDASAVMKTGLLIGPPFVMMGCFFLLLDLGRPSIFYAMMKRPKESWITRGFYIVSAFILLGLAYIVLWLGPWQVIEDFSGLWSLFGFVVGFLAVLTMIYPALLLGCSPIPLWNTPILPILFLVSSASMGMAAIVLSMVLVSGASPQGVSFLLRADALFIVAEIFVILVYFYGTKLLTIAGMSVRNIMGGRLAPLFWGGVVLVGLMVPLALELAGRWSLFAAVCILVGGYLLRYVVVAGGIKIPLSAQGMTIPIPGKN